MSTLIIPKHLAVYTLDVHICIYMHICICMQISYIYILIPLDTTLEDKRTIKGVSVSESIKGNF